MGGQAGPRLHPLRLRGGARYRCFGDGLCCTDIHALGPLTRRELTQIRRIDPSGAGPQDGFDEPMLRTRPDGGCVFLLPDRRCRIHAELGYEAKPGGCRRFPVGLVATPEGGRVTTDHRCPCRTVGERPELTVEEARPALVDDAGRLTADRRIDRIHLDRDKQVSFARYAALERALLDRLAAGERPEDVLDARPFPKLRGTSWRFEGEQMLEAEDDSQFGAALRWFGDALLAQVDEHHSPPPRPRPWAEAFERALGRAEVPRQPDEVLADWVADELWALRWADEDWSLARARAEIASRLAVARHILERLRAEGLRADHAAAEAVSIIDMLGSSEYWEDIVDAMRV